jgi:hypothetical protein
MIETVIVTQAQAGIIMIYSVTVTVTGHGKAYATPGPAEPCHGARSDTGSARAGSASSLRPVSGPGRESIMA